MVLLPVTLFNDLTGSYIYHVIILVNVFMFGHFIKIYWVFSKLNTTAN